MQKLVPCRQPPHVLMQTAETSHTLHFRGMSMTALQAGAMPATAAGSRACNRHHGLATSASPLRPCSHARTRQRAPPSMHARQLLKRGALSAPRPVALTSRLRLVVLVHMADDAIERQ